MVKRSDGRFLFWAPISERLDAAFSPSGLSLFGLPVSPANPVSLQFHAAGLHSRHHPLHAAAAMARLEFAGFALDLEQGRLRDRAGDVALRHKSLCLLAYLLRNRG